jgi:predicted nucleic acid-binding protein
VKVFIDTSALIKLYFSEADTPELDKLFSENTITEIFVSELTKTEFFSAIYKKLRTGELQPQNAKDILDAFVGDEHKYQFILLDSSVINTSQYLIRKYGISGLRSLDAIQLASACSVIDQLGLAISSDKLLNQFLLAEGIRISP